MFRCVRCAYFPFHNQSEVKKERNEKRKERKKEKEEKRERLSEVQVIRLSKNNKISSSSFYVIMYEETTLNMNSKTTFFGIDE